LWLNGGDALDAFAEVVAEERHTALNAWVVVTKVASMLLNASIDPAVVKDVEKFAREDNRVPSASFMASSASIGKSMAERLSRLSARLDSGEQAAEVVSSTAGCFHLTGAPDVLHATEAGVWLPLNKKVVALAGLVTFTPLTHNAFTTSTTVFSHNKELDTIDVYAAAASSSNLVDPDVVKTNHHHEAKFYVGPADGAKRPVVADGRVGPLKHSLAGKTLNKLMFRAWASLPADFHYLAAAPETVCPDGEFAEKTASYWEANVVKSMFSDSMVTKLRTLGVLSSLLDCAVDYLAAANGNPHAFSPFESIVFLHAIIEFPEAALTRKWNIMPWTELCPSGRCVQQTTTVTTTVPDPWWKFW
jgi:hypothetical protein